MQQWTTLHYLLGLFKIHVLITSATKVEVT